VGLHQRPECRCRALAARSLPPLYQPARPAAARRAAANTDSASHPSPDSGSNRPPNANGHSDACADSGAAGNADTCSHPGPDGRANQGAYRTALNTIGAANSPHRESPGCHTGRPSGNTDRQALETAALAYLGRAHTGCPARTKTNAKATTQAQANARPGPAPGRQESAGTGGQAN